MPNENALVSLKARNINIFPTYKTDYMSREYHFNSIIVRLEKLLKNSCFQHSSTYGKNVLKTNFLSKLFTGC